MEARRFVTAALTLLVAAFLLVPSLVAQSLVSGDLTGTVTDPSGAVVPDATVTARNNSTGQTLNTTTNSRGAYRFSLLSPGNYTVTANAQGFSKAETKAAVAVGQATTADVKLAVGSNSQTVEVTAATPLVQPDTAEVSTNFDQTMIANQPNAGNDLTYIAQTAPGVTMNTGQGYGNFSSFGLPATSNLFTVNGENDMDPYLNLNNSGATNLTLGKNDVQEATVVNNAYSGQYGQQAGAQVSYVTKSGSNELHGNLLYWWTGSRFDANDWFNTFTSPVTPRPFANNNQWAASVGGPIKKDKLFFFVDQEGIRYIVPTTQPVYAWSPNFIAGSLAAVAATNPAELPLYTQYYNLFQTARGYPGATLNTAATGDGGCGAPIAGNCIASYQGTPSLPAKEWILSGRIDYNATDNDHLFWRARIDHGTQATYADPINPAFNAASFQPAYDGQGQWTHAFGANATNQFIYAGSYYRAIFTQTNPGLFPYAVLPTSFNLTQVGGLVYDFPQGRNVTQYQFVDDFSLTKGAHALRFGGNFRRYDITDYTFSVLNNPEVLVSDPAAFYTGLAFQTRQRFPSRATEPVALWGAGIYGQDEWRVAKGLRLTLALRLEHNSNPVCQLHCGSLLRGDFNTLLAQGAIAPTTPYSQLIQAGRHGLYRAVDTVDVSPRFGFAWSPGGNDKTVVRGGFGVFYDAFPAVVSDQFMLNLPNVVTVYTTNPAGTPWADTTTAASPYVQGAASAAAIRSGFASGASYASLVAALGPGFRTPTFANQVGTFHTPYYQQWSLQLQQALGNRSAFTLGYVGNHGVRIPIDNPGVNSFVPAPGLPGFPLTPPSGCATPACTRSAIFSTVAQYYSGAVSNYNGLTATFQQRVTYGFTVQASYTWSHAMDEVSNSGIASTPFNNGTAPSLVYQINPTCLRCNNYGNADYDIRHNFNANYVWQVPWKFNHGIVNGILGGWTISQNFFVHSGLPYSVLDGFVGISNWTPNGGINVADVLNYSQGPCTNGRSTCVTPAQFFDTSMGAVPPTFPNQRRNQFRGPGFFDSDATVTKNFKITERVALGIGANAYNVFNHPNFDLPDNVLGDATFGMPIRTTAPPTTPYGAFVPGLPSGRILQFQGKVTF
jgi:hypothetical protein